MPLGDQTQCYFLKRLSLEDEYVTDQQYKLLGRSLWMWVLNFCPDAFYIFVKYRLAIANKN